MSSRKTTNLGLHAWEPEDLFSREEFNENFDTIDTSAGNTRKELEAKITAAAELAGEAAAAAKSAAETAQAGVDGASAASASAQKAADTAAQAASTATQAAQAAQNALDAAAGSVRIETGSYQGTGTINMDASSPTTIPIGFAAKAVWVSTNGTTSGMDEYDNTGLSGSKMDPWLLFTRDMSQVYVRVMDSFTQWVYAPLTLIWSATELKLYATLPWSTSAGNGSFRNAEVCLNESDVTYRWIAIG